MNITSYQRLRRYLAPKSGDNLTSDEKSRRDLIRWISVASSRIEQYLSRTFQKSSSITEYFDVGFSQREFFVLATPVTAITSVYYDHFGLFDGGESELTNAYIGLDGNAVVLRSSLPVVQPRALRVIYAGGMADSGVLSTFTVADTTGWTAGKFVYGSTSGALGIVSSVPSVTTITVEVLYGVFDIGETLVEQDSESSAGTSTATAILISRLLTSMAEAYPDIVTAAEMQIRYLWQNKDTFELSGISKDGTTNRGNNVTQVSLSLQPEVISILEPHRRVVL